jgi:hypothetical protein
VTPDGPPDFEELMADADWRRATQVGNGPACNPWEGATPQEIAAELPEPPKAWRSSTLRHIADHFIRQARFLKWDGAMQYAEWTNWAAFLRQEADRIEEAE